MHVQEPTANLLTKLSALTQKALAFPTSLCVNLFILKNFLSRSTSSIDVAVKPMPVQSEASACHSWELALFGEALQHGVRVGKDAVSSGVARQRYQVCVLILQCPAEGSQLLLLRAVRLLQPPGHRQRAVGGHLGAQRLLSHHPAKWTPRNIPASAAWATSLARPVTPVSQACARDASPARHGLKQNGFSVITVLLNPIPPGKTQIAAGYVLSFPKGICLSSVSSCLFGRACRPHAHSSWENPDRNQLRPAFFPMKAVFLVFLRLPVRTDANPNPWRSWCPQG